MDRDVRRLRSRGWFDRCDDPTLTAIYLERAVNYGLTVEELRDPTRPIIGIAQTGSDLVPCNRHHLVLAERVRDGIRDAGGIPIEFPVHPIQETTRRPSSALDRNLTYLGLVEILHGYPFDGVVLTTGCDKTTPALMMSAATMNLPAIVLSGGPMLNGWHNGQRAGSGTVIWESRKRLAAGEIDFEEFMAAVGNSAPSVGHCNSMGTALSMNGLAEVLGMALPGCASIPAPYRERGQMAYRTGREIVRLALEEVRPSQIMIRAAFEAAIVVASAIGASTNCPPHLVAIARHMGVELTTQDWDRLGYDIPLLVNCMPAGSYLGEEFHRAGGIQAVVHELVRGGLLGGDHMTVNGRTLAENCAATPSRDHDVIRPVDRPLMANAGFAVLSGNLFDSALMKTSVISPDFRRKYLEDPEHPGVFEGRAIVFEGPEDYHARLNDPELSIDEDCILFIRNCGPVGYPGAPEVVGMMPPAELLKRGVTVLPSVGDGRQSGTSQSPSVLNASPEAAVGGGLALLRTGDHIRFDIGARRADILISDAEYAQRNAAWKADLSPAQTPWQEMQRMFVGQLDTGACLEMAVGYQRLAQGPMPRDNH